MTKPLAWLPSFVQEHRQVLGVWLFALWALVLTLVALTNILLLTKIIELGYDPSLQPSIWLIFGLNVVLAVGFGLSAYGLWRRFNWGRLLFLGMIVTWSIFNIAALFMPGLILYARVEHPFSRLVVDGLRFAVGPIVSLWYFNLARIKILFQPDSLKNQIFEEVRDHDDVS